MRARAMWLAIVAVIIATRMCHVDLLWIEEAYGLAAAQELLRGKVLYRDIWFDKPPLYAMFYALWGATQGWPLRLAGSLYVVFASWCAYYAGRRYWGEREGLAAAALLAFLLTFGIPAAVMALAPDLLAVPFHLLAMFFVWRRKPALAGAAAAVAFWANPKGLLILLVAALWHPESAPRVLAGFAGFSAIPVAALVATGAWSDYVAQVWTWGRGYAESPVVEDPVLEGLRRTANWAGFQASIVVASVLAFVKERNWRWIVWIAVSVVGVVAGWRFFPRYYFMLLPVLVLLGARGLVLARPAVRYVLVLLLLVPLVRFGPRYVQLADGHLNGVWHEWSDLALMNDSESAAEGLRESARSRDTVLVWGYRPDIYVFSQLPAASRFMDSQPLTGVLADRHLVDSRPTFAAWAKANRRELIASRPMFIVDALGSMNPELAIRNYPDLRDWLSAYREVRRAGTTVIYSREHDRETFR